MTKTAKIFKNGRSQAVRLPAEFRFGPETTEVSIRKDAATGNIILSGKRPAKGTWAEFFAMVKEAGALPNLLTEEDRRDTTCDSDQDPFAGWKE